jgi:hypothetical protein
MHTPLRYKCICGIDVRLYLVAARRQASGLLLPI